MIPSDHFVKFYAEAFKYLQKQGGEAVNEYYRTISRHQEGHCLKLFQQKGLAGMKEYWDKIVFEENCDADTKLEEDKCYTFVMHHCPSLAKVIDNDAEPCGIYCDHCPGWVLPIMTKTGFYCVTDLVRPDVPRCVMKIFAKLDDAKKYLEMAKKRHPGHPERLKHNLS